MDDVVIDIIVNFSVYEVSNDVIVYVVVISMDNCFFDLLVVELILEILLDFVVGED